MVADYDDARAAQAADAVGDAGSSAAQVDAASAEAVAALVREHGITHVMNAVDPRFVMPIFDGALAGGADYLDMAMSPVAAAIPSGRTSSPASSSATSSSPWRISGSRRAAGAGRNRCRAGLSDVFARYAADHLFSEIDELGMRDGSNLTSMATSSHRRSPSGRPSRSASTRR